MENNFSKKISTRRKGGVSVYSRADVMDKETTFF